jgi:membrane protein
LGAFFLYTTSVALMKALFVAHALIWQVPVPRIAHKPRAVGELLLAMVLLILSSCVASVVRDHSPGYGLVLMLADTLIYAVIWWGFSSRLPHGAASLLELLPGALLFSLGAQVLHLVAVYYLAARLTRASVLYGSLGIAAAILFGLYLVGRLIVASAVLNAGLFMRQHPTADPSGHPLSGRSADSPLAGDATRPPKPLIGGSSGEP